MIPGKETNSMTETFLVYELPAALIIDSIFAVVIGFGLLTIFAELLQ